MPDQAEWGKTETNRASWFGGVWFYDQFCGQFLTSKTCQVQIFPITCNFLRNRSHTKKSTRIFSENNFMANKLYFMTFFSKLILFIDYSEIVIEKHNKSKFLIRHESVISDGPKIFCKKFLGPLWKILTWQKSICENLYPNPRLIHILYVCSLLFHYIFLHRSCLIGNT